MHYKYLGITLFGAVCLGLSACAPSPADIGLTQQKWDNATPQEQNCWQRAYQDYQDGHPELDGDGSSSNKVDITITGGTAAFPPAFQQLAFNKIRDQLPAGACHSLNVVATNNNYATSLYICYAKNTIAIDPSHYDSSTRAGSLILTNNPLWKRGFSYKNMFTDGYVKFKNITITVKRHG